MTPTPPETSPYLRRPLYVYDLPPELLESFTTRTSPSSISHVVEDSQTSSPSRSAKDDGDGIASSTSCALCKAEFKTVSEQRQHVRTDLHKYNLKLKIRGIPTVDETTFLRQIGELDESISGSGTSDSEDDEKDVHAGDSTLAALLRRQAKLAAPEHDGGFTSQPKRSGGNAPILWMSSPKIGDGVGLGIYKAILTDAEQQEAPSYLVEIVKRKQVTPMLGKQSGSAYPTAGDLAVKGSDPHFFLCMIGGGHFAASVVGLVPEVRKGPGGVEERHAIVKAHKTFHRYTTRRKQGGSQSANDNSKGNAHSAGSSIRRYNEAALENDVRKLLADWKSMIDSAELLFIRATGSTSRRTLFGPYEGQILSSRDKRLRGFPFSTRRPTQGELLRSFQELTRLKVSRFVEVVEEKSERETSTTPMKHKSQVPEMSREEATAMLHTSQLQNLIRRTKAPAMLLYLAKNELSANYLFHPALEHHHSPTPLHLAASINAPALVSALLIKAKADPTITNAEGKTAYDIAGDVKTRDAFRIARHQLGENSFDWNAAHVSSAISPAEAEAKAKTEQDQASAAEAKRRKADLEKIRQEEEVRAIHKIEKKGGSGKTLGAVAEKTGSDRREEETRGLAPEMRQRLERERRARAAEARLKAASGDR